MSFAEMNRYEIESIVESIYYKVLLEAQKIYPTISVPKLDCVSNGTGVAGTYYSKQHKIEINVAYVFAGLHSLRETITHELCHHIQYQFYKGFKQWHGPEFRFIMQQFGYRGNTYHTNSKHEAAKVAKKQKNDLFPL